MNFLILSALPLGLDGVKILLYLFNFALLMTGLTVLLYKPILKFMKKRQEIISSQLKENEETKQNAQAMLKEYQVKLEKASDEIDLKKADAQKAIQSEKEKILSQAEEKAEDILKKAEEECERERVSAISDLQNELADVAVTIAKNILEREISREENSQIIDACVKEWIDND